MSLKHCASTRWNTSKRDSMFTTTNGDSQSIFPSKWPPDIGFSSWDFFSNSDKPASIHRLDDVGRVVQVQFGNAMRSWFYDCPPEEVQKIYEWVSRKKEIEITVEKRNLVPWKCLLNTAINLEIWFDFNCRMVLLFFLFVVPNPSLYLWSISNFLNINNSGDTVLWANTRVLHTRDAFRNAPGEVRNCQSFFYPISTKEPYSGFQNLIEFWK